MKRTIFTLLLLSSISLVLRAQTPPRCLAQRNAYVCTELGLSDEECEVVSTLLNELDTKRIALWKEYKTQALQLRDKKEVTQEEVLLHLKQRTEWKIAESKLVEEYYTRLCQHISPKKVLLLEHTQRKFGRSLMRKKQDNPTTKSESQQRKKPKGNEPKRR